MKDHKCFFKSKDCGTGKYLMTDSFNSLSSLVVYFLTSNNLEKTKNPYLGVEIYSFFYSKSTLYFSWAHGFLE